MIKIKRLYVSSTETESLVWITTTLGWGEIYIDPGEQLVYSAHH